MPQENFQWHWHFLEGDDLSVTSIYRDVVDYIRDPLRSYIEDHFVSISSAMEKRARGEELTESDPQLPPK